MNNRRTINEEWFLETWHLASASWTREVLIHRCSTLPYLARAMWGGDLGDGGAFVCNNDRCVAISPREITDIALLAGVSQE